MSNVNKVILMGRLGVDPELRYTKGGQATCSLRLATSEVWGTGDARQERTEWHRVVLWGRQAELAKEYLAKGRLVYIEGRLQTRKWQDKDGHDRYTTEIVAREIQFIDGKRGGSGGGGNEPPGPDDSSAPYLPEADDDIPF